jgi:mRNA interferase RelE/StbE
MYSLIIMHTAEKQLKKLDAVTQTRIISALDRCKIRPHAHVKKLVSSPYFRLRVGDYRVIMDIKGRELAILVLEVGHRRDVYK